MKKIFNILNLVLISLVLVGDVFYILKGTLLIKSLTSAGFLLLGVINLVYVIKNKEENLKFCVMMVSGLLFAMLGDIILEIDFIIGALLFAVGHVLYFVAYCFVCKFNWKDLIYGACIFIPATGVILFAPIFNFGGNTLKWLCVIYAIIISCMTGKAVANFIREKSLLTIILMLGSALFLISDLMLLFSNFTDISGVFRYLCLITYYPAECLLAHSLMHTKKSSV